MTAKRNDHPTIPNAAKRRREAVTRTVARGASGSVQLARGRFVTPKDKDLNKLDKI